MFLTALPVFFGEAPPHHLGMGVSDPKTDSPWRHHGLDTPVFPLGCTKIGKLWPPGFVVRLHEHYGISTPNWHARLSCEETHHGYPLGGEPSSYRARGASDHTPRPEKSKRQTANRQAETLLTYGAPYHILRTPRWIGTHLTNEGPPLIGRNRRIASGRCPIAPAWTRQTSQNARAFRGVGSCPIYPVQKAISERLFRPLTKRGMGPLRSSAATWIQLSGNGIPSFLPTMMISMRGSCNY